MKSPEKWEKDEVDAYLATIGAKVFKPATFGYGVSGCSDRLVCYKGKFIACEVKRPGKTPTKPQWDRINEVQAAGGIAVWGTSAKIIAELNAILFPHAMRMIEFAPFKAPTK